MSPATLLAVALALTLAGQTAAASFSSAVRVNPSTVEVWQDVDFAVASYTTAIGAYMVQDGSGEDGPNLKLYVRRTTNGGESWGTPLLLAGSGEWPSVAARGSAVDVVFTRRYPDSSVRYRRSLDRGATFGEVMQISITNRATDLPEVARGPDGLVAIVWQDRQRPNVWVRVSQNGGTTFALPMVLANDAGNFAHAVAVGNGVIYAAYSNSSQQLVMRRSTDAGSTWSAPKVLSETSIGIPSLTAMDGTAFVAFRTPGNSGQATVIRYRGTTNRGVSWSSPKTISPLAWHSREPDITLDDGGIRVVFARCLEDGPADCRVMYTQSTDRITWSTPQRVSSYLMTEAFLPHVGSAKGKLGRRLYVMYYGILNGSEDAYLHSGLP